MYRLQRIDELFLPSHKYLDSQDECYFFMNYTRLDLGFTRENDLIMNFKKKMDRIGKSDWKYKLSAIQEISKMFIQNIAPFDPGKVLMIPIPPSRIETDPLYDDRIVKIVNNFVEERKDAESRNAIRLNQNMIPTHVAKLPPEELLEYLKIDEGQCDIDRETIILVDDVITEGAHFKACQAILKSRYPSSRIVGLFAARTIH